MREIKFRAWAKNPFGLKGWEMVHSVGVYPNDSHYAGPLCASSDGIFVRADKPEDVILMQFTGLKDKNGKEIYEGDIVRVSDEWDGRTYSHILEIRWQDGLGFVCDSDCPASGITNYDSIEVIGNIYESPELLK